MLGRSQVFVGKQSTVNMLIQSRIKYPTHIDTGEYSESEMLRTTGVLNFMHFQSLKYLHIYNVLSWTWNPNLKMKFTYFLYVPYKHSHKVILYNSFNVPVFLTVSYHMRSSAEFSTCGILSAFKEYWGLEHFRFLFFQLGMFYLLYFDGGQIG